MSYPTCDRCGGGGFFGGQGVDIDDEYVCCGCLLKERNELVKMIVDIHNVMLGFIETVKKKVFLF